MQDYHITPEEVVALYGYASLKDIYMARDIGEAYARAQPRKDHICSIYGACFYAGIVEGVRRERAKRRNVSDNPHVQCAVSMLRGIKSEKTLGRICRFIQHLWIQEGQP